MLCVLRAWPYSRRDVAPRVRVCTVFLFETASMLYQVLFDTLKFHGAAFTPPFWARVFDSVLLPIFDHVRAEVRPPCHPRCAHDAASGSAWQLFGLGYCKAHTGIALHAPHEACARLGDETGASHVLEGRSMRCKLPLRLQMLSKPLNDDAFSCQL